MDIFDEIDVIGVQIHSLKNLYILNIEIIIWNNNLKLCNLVLCSMFKLFFKIIDSFVTGVSLINFLHCIKC